MLISVNDLALHVQISIPDKAFLHYRVSQLVDKLVALAHILRALDRVRSTCQTFGRVHVDPDWWV